MSLNIFIANHELEEFYGGIMYKPSGRLRLHTMGLLRFEFFLNIGTSNLWPPIWKPNY